MRCLASFGVEGGSTAGMPKHPANALVVFPPERYALETRPCIFPGPQLPTGIALVCNPWAVLAYSASQSHDENFLLLCRVRDDYGFGSLHKGCVGKGLEPVNTAGLADLPLLHTNPLFIAWGGIHVRNGACCRQSLAVVPVPVPDCLCCFGPRVRSSLRSYTVGKVFLVG